MNPFFLKKYKNKKGYDSLKTESSKEERNPKNHQENIEFNEQINTNEPKSDDKISEFNSEPSENTYQVKEKENNNPSEFRASFPSNHKEEKKKRYSKAFARFKKRYSAIPLKEENKVKGSEKIRNIVAMLEKQIKGEFVEEKKEEGKKNEFLEKRNTVIQNDILFTTSAFVKIQKKKGQRPSVVNFE